MVILDVTLFEQGSHIIQEITSQLQHPVRFLPQIVGRSAYGSTDTNVTENAYTVYLRNDMPDLEFETCLLHELRHLVQHEKLFPLVCNKVHSPLFEKEPHFFMSLGSCLASFLLDLDVINWLSSVGYSSDIFSPFDHETDLSSVTKSMTHKGLEDSFNMCSAVLSMFVAYTRATPTSKNVIYSAFDRFPEVQSEFETILNHIDISKCSDPQYILEIFSFIFDRYSLWRAYYIMSGQLVFKTSSSLKQHLSTKG